MDSNTFATHFSLMWLFHYVSFVLMTTTKINSIASVNCTSNYTYSCGGGEGLQCRTNLISSFDYSSSIYSCCFRFGIALSTSFYGISSMTRLKYFLISR
mmetsp:Transcript_11566/g.17506  ORF Transcript_11566/g.17506 Transcript_11566/m.17506 type:complete len:99 (-) Transcript_11566:122-418(-)